MNRGGWIIQVAIDYFRLRPEMGGPEAGVTVTLPGGDRFSFRASGVDYTVGSGSYTTHLHEVMVWEDGVSNEVAYVKGTSDVLWVLHGHLQERFGASV